MANFFNIESQKPNGDWRPCGTKNDKAEAITEMERLHSRSITAPFRVVEVVGVVARRNATSSHTELVDAKST